MKGEWKIFLESILLESRSGRYRCAVRLADEALLLHAGTGRLWAILVQLCHRLEGLLWTKKGKRGGRGRGREGKWSRKGGKGEVKVESDERMDDLVAHCGYRDSREVADTDCEYVAVDRDRDRDRHVDVDAATVTKVERETDDYKGCRNVAGEESVHACEGEFSEMRNILDSRNSMAVNENMNYTNHADSDDNSDGDSDTDYHGSDNYPIPSQHAVLVRAIQEVPKSGEVWCEGARCHMNPLQLSSFDLTNAQKFLSFAVQFTPQYGDTFIEYLRLEMIIQVILPRVLYTLGIPIAPFYTKHLQYDVESDIFSLSENDSWLANISRSDGGNVDEDKSRSCFMNLSDTDRRRRKRMESIINIEHMDFDFGHCVEAYKNVELKNLYRRCV